MSKSLQLRGAAAITEMLDMIGATEMPDADHMVAAILVNHEMDIRELLAFALTKLADPQPSAAPIRLAHHAPQAV